MKRRGKTGPGSTPRQALAVAIALLLPGVTKAGDILRPGGKAPGQPGNTAPASPNPAVVDAARANFQNSLARTTQTIQALHAMQQKARDLAQRPAVVPAVPNGLGPGGLQRATGGTWTGAGLPIQTGAASNPNVVVKQNQPQAILTWQTFNVGRETTLTFDQSAGGKQQGQWVAINRITDPSGKPSQILGRIEAGGQVYVLNQNGILFGTTAQVNTHALVASSLPINDNLVAQGFLNNPDAQFLFSSLPIPALTNNATMPAFTPPPAPAGGIGDVVVERGAQLSAPTSPDKVGGRIALIGPNVRNDGTIATPDGQTILAAGWQVGLAAHQASDPSLRGLDVYIGKVAANGVSAGTATNTGVIEAPRAEVTMAGKTVSQLGAIASSTSVAVNGRIDLNASYNATSPVVLGVARFAPGATGEVTLGAGSATTIVPELASTETIAASRLPIASQVNVTGGSIQLASGAELFAPNAAVSLRAGTWLPFNGSTRLVASTGRIQLGAGAEISVAGTPDALAEQAQNILTLQLRGAELADSPLQREGLLRALSLTVDLRQSGTYDGLAWVGTPLGDATGFLNLIKRNAAQLTVGGGSVTMSAGQAVTLAGGSRVDVSGGWTSYAGGFVETSRVIAGGHIIDIANATPDLVYTGIYHAQSTEEHARWGVSESFAQPLGLTGRHWEDAYVQGADAGSISITAPSMVLDGTLLGKAISGPRQRETPAQGGKLALSFTSENPATPLYLPVSPVPPAIVLAEGGSVPGELTLAPERLAAGGFANLSIYNPDGEIAAPGGVTLAMPTGGSVTLAAANLSIGGAIVAPGGTIALTAYNLSPAEYARLKAQTSVAPATPAPTPGRGTLTLGPGARLSTAGLVVDERADLTSPLILNGGSVTLAGYDVELARGSTIDSSGGVRLAANGRETFGAGGSIAVQAGQDPAALSVLGGRLTLGASLRAFSGTVNGGALSLQAPATQVGGAATAADTLVLAPEFFEQGGFTSYTLTGLRTATVAPGTALAPVAQSWLAEPQEGLALRPVLKPVGERGAANFTLLASGVADAFSGALVRRGEVVLGAGASIVTDPSGGVKLKGDTVTVLGAITAPGGQITIAGNNNSTAIFANQTQALATVYLGPGASLSAAGATVLTENAFGWRTGTVLPGGSIAISGNIDAQPGAVLDVSGASDRLAFGPAAVTGESSALVAASRGLTRAPLGQAASVQEVASDGGSIVLRGAQSLQSDATLRGFAGGASAQGGSLSIASGRFYAPASGALPSPLDVTLQVTQGGLAQAPGSGVGAVLPGFGQFTANRFAASGLDSLALGGTVRFAGPVMISARRELSVADAGVLYADGTVQLSGAAVKLGTPLLPPVDPASAAPPFTQNGLAVHFAPSTGSGVLLVRAGLLEVGNLSLQNISRAGLSADGDLRGAGTLDIAGDLSLRAAQIYPPTALSFTISASEKNIAIANSVAGQKTVTLASTALPPGFGVGSPLLGSTVTQIDGTAVTLATGANASFQGRTLVTYAPGSGSVTIASGGAAPRPLSAGGTLSVYAANIRQAGTLVAPFGQINLGWDGAGAAPVDAISGAPAVATRTVTLAAGSLTSVAATNADGAALLVPYGLNLNDLSWIDPRGVDITGGGGPRKAVNIAGARVRSEAGSVIDLSGGGDLYAYRWVQGLGGTRDILKSTTSFAVVPDYAGAFAPYAPFNPAAGNLGGDPGYVNASLRPGDRVWLGASSGLAAGLYTLLPARYALLPGAVLVTPKTGAAVGSIALPDGASLVSGYRVNDLGGHAAGAALYSRFEVAPGAVLRERAQYADYFANSYLLEGAQRLDVAVPRLPGDAGHLVLEATQAMAFAGHVAAPAPPGFRGGEIDIASSGDIVIGGPAQAGGGLALSIPELNAFGGESLLIGGLREFTSTGASVTVLAGKVSMQGPGPALAGSDIILVAKSSVSVGAGARLEQSGSMPGGAETLFLGQAGQAGSGDGALLRVSSDPAAAIVRAGVSASTAPELAIGPGAQLAAASLILDSTAGGSLAPTAQLRAGSLTLDGGRLSVLLANPGAAAPADGLTLGQAQLAGLARAQRLSLLSYSTLDFYGTGAVATRGALALHTGAIRGFGQAGGAVDLTAGSLLLDNPAGSPASASAVAGTGALRLRAGKMQIGARPLALQQFSAVEIDAPGGLRMAGFGGLTADGALTIRTPAITAAKGASQSIVVAGALQLAETPATDSPDSSGLGATLLLQGSSVESASAIVLPSGRLTLRAASGDLTVEGRLATPGVAQTFDDITRFTPAGSITLLADAGQVALAADGVVDVSSSGAGGNLTIRAPLGAFTAAGTLRGGAGASFSLDAGTLPSLAPLAPLLTAGGFTQAQTFRVRTGDVTVDGQSTAHTFNLSADQGSIAVTGTVDASGTRGGAITLTAAGALTLDAGSRLTVAAQQFDAAGKGGAVTLATTGQLDLLTGSTIDLSVAAASSQSAAAGEFTGTLHLRAPQLAGGSDLALGVLDSTLVAPSRITVEGYQVFDLTGSGQITTAVQNAVLASGATFGGGATAARLLAGHAAWAPVLVITPGAEIVNASGDLTLGASTSTAASDWNLALDRFGPHQAPGYLTLRAAGNIVLYNALSDGFATSTYNSALLADNPLLPENAQSWSYQLTAGADFTAVDRSRVAPLTALGANAGSVLLGKNAGPASATTPGLNAQTSAVVGNRFQTVRTGSGDITLSAGRDVQLLNPFASIYTAGTAVADPTLGGTFDLPQLIGDPAAGVNVLGAVQQNPSSPVQFTEAGGNVTVTAQQDLAHYTRDGDGRLVADSSRELPMNWLYRRGFVNQNTGHFGVAGGPGRAGEIASTAWWVDFTNFFQEVGALGGGNVTLQAGRDIANVDASIPTNARAAKGSAASAPLVELGGGDLLVQAGRNLDAGVYYVERGRGTLNAGGGIVTNATRSPSLTSLNSSSPLAPQTWLPTTLFLGAGSFDVSAQGDLLLGPVANPFLLPQGYNNTVWYKTYFSTYAADSAVKVSSLAGAVTLRDGASVSGNSAQPILQAWLDNELAVKSTSASYFQPWLRLDETSSAPFATVSALAPGTLRATAFSGNLNLVGSFLLSPSATGTVELAAAGSLNGLNPNGSVLIAGSRLQTWGSARIDLSDADPARIPGPDSPFAYQTLVGVVPGLALTTRVNFLAPLDALFAETGAVQGPQVTLTAKEALHDSTLLHARDPEPVRLLAAGGSISGVTLYAGKRAEILAGGDISDVALYLQNVSPGDTTIVAAGRDLLPYDANSPLRVAAQAAGNLLNVNDRALAGDLQLAGPGALEVLAGRNLDLGIGPINTDGTGVGIVTVGNQRNPALPSTGASIVAGAGLGPSTGLAASGLDFSTFTRDTLTPAVLAKYLPQLDLDLAAGVTPTNFARLPAEQRDRLALGVFYLILRDAGRAAGQPGGSYDPGFAAIGSLFGGVKATGDIALTSRAIKTETGGTISLLAPHGKITVGFDVAGAQAVDQGILTADGGGISIFSSGDVNVGTSRIFTLRGGDLVIWSSDGNIDAGAAAKTVASAPPTRVIIDPQSGDVATDLAGLATGGGIGVLATVENVPPGNVDLIAPRGAIDAGDAGIRSTGNLNVAAVQVLNAGNIQVAGSTSGAPAAPAVVAPNLGALSAAASATGAATQAAGDLAKSAAPPSPAAEADLPSIITVEVLGYGGE